MQLKRLHILLLLLVVTASAMPFRARLFRPAAMAIQVSRGGRTTADRVNQFGGVVRARLAPNLKRAGVAYPPARVTLVGLKAERTMQVWVSGPDRSWKHLKDYPILGMSGTLGPKLRQGDLQVPEGLYRVESLNPNSRYHLALRVNYPNAEDRRHGREDGRAQLGSDIMIHGSNCSIGCLAMGDEAAEELFVLAADVGIGNVAIILSPVDFRTRALPVPMPPVPAWTAALYASIQAELAKLAKPAK